MREKDLMTNMSIKLSMNEKQIKKSKHRGWVDSEEGKAVCICGKKFKERDSRFEAYEDLRLHYSEAGTLEQYGDRKNDRTML